jgi:hypothetical protein
MSPSPFLDSFRLADHTPTIRETIISFPIARYSGTGDDCPRLHWLSDKAYLIGFVVWDLDSNRSFSCAAF